MSVILKKPQHHSDDSFMRQALRLARRGNGATSPNPMVGALLAKRGKVIGRGWHHRAGEPHAEIEALRDAARRGNKPQGSTLYVTLEPCCTHGRTPPCTSAIIEARIKRVVVGATDPNPAHQGQGFRLLKKAGIEVVSGILSKECTELNAAFNHWIIHNTPLVTVKSAMTLDGKIATASGESKWITGEEARAYGMHLRQGSDAILVGVNTILADDPSLTVRKRKAESGKAETKNLRRIILDSMARTPLSARVANDQFAALTTIVVSTKAPKRRVAALAKKVNIMVAPFSTASRSTNHSKLDLAWILKRLGAEKCTNLLVEGGGEVNASFLLGGFAHRVAFFYAPRILGGSNSKKGVAGDGVKSLSEAIMLTDVNLRKLGSDLLLTAEVVSQ